MTRTPHHDFDRPRPGVGRRRVAIAVAGIVLATIGWLSVQRLGGPVDVADHPSQDAGQNLTRSSLVLTNDTVVIVRLARRPSAGVLHIAQGPDPARVTATMTGGEAGDEVVVFGAEVRIVNSELSRAHYEIRVPASVVRGEVRVGTAVVARQRLDTTAWMVELSP